MEIITTLSFFLIIFFFANFSKAVTATPVWGQLKVPVKSTLADAVASSSSLASSTMPSNFLRYLSPC